jgi:hypothetical protein
VSASRYPFVGTTGKKAMRRSDKAEDICFAIVTYGFFLNVHSLKMDRGLLLCHVLLVIRLGEGPEHEAV